MKEFLNFKQVKSLFRGKRILIIAVAIVGIFLSFQFLRFANRELSIVKISTEYGTLELTENVAVTQKESITQTIQTVDGYPYTVFKLSSDASVVGLSGFDPLAEDQRPNTTGVQSGHEVIIIFDADASTEEALFFDITLNIGGVRWDQATVYSGKGIQLKVFTPPPQYDTGNFFIFFYQNEVERNWPSLMFQFKGYQDSYNRNVFVTTYYSLVYSYLEPEVMTTQLEDTTGIDQETEPLISPNISIFYFIFFFMVFIYFKKQHKKKKEKIE